MRKFFNNLKGKSKGKKLGGKDKSKSTPDVRTKESSGKDAGEAEDDEPELRPSPGRHSASVGSISTVAKAGTTAVDPVRVPGPVIRVNHEENAEESDAEPGQSDECSGETDESGHSEKGVPVETVIPPRLIETNETSPEWSDEYSDSDDEDEEPKAKALPVEPTEKSKPEIGKSQDHRWSRSASLHGIENSSEEDAPNPEPEGTLGREGTLLNVDEIFKRNETISPSISEKLKEGQAHGSEGSQGDVDLKSPSSDSDWSSIEEVHSVGGNGEISKSGNDIDGRPASAKAKEVPTDINVPNELQQPQSSSESGNNWDDSHDQYTESIAHSPAPVVTRKYSWELDPSERFSAAAQPGSEAIANSPSKGLDLVIEEEDKDINFQLLQMFDSTKDLSSFKQASARETPSPPIFEPSATKNREETESNSSPMNFVMFDNNNDPLTGAANTENISDFESARASGVPEVKVPEEKGKGEHEHRSEFSKDQTQSEAEESVNSMSSTNSEESPKSPHVAKIDEQETLLKSRLFLNLEKTRAPATPPVRPPSPTESNDLNAEFDHQQSPADLTYLQIQTSDPNPAEISTSSSESTPVELEPNFHPKDDSSDHSADEIGPENKQLFAHDSGTDLDRIRSSEVFGTCESEPKLSIEDELTTLFQARGLGRTRSSSIASFSSMYRVSDTIDNDATSTPSGFMKFQRIGSMNQLSLPSVSSSNTQTYEFPLQPPIPLSSLLMGFDSQSNIMPMEMESKTAPPTKASLRRFSSPNFFATKRSISPIPEIPQANSIPTLERRSNVNAILTDEAMDHVLEKTKKMIETKIPESADESGTDSEEQERINPAKITGSQATTPASVNRDASSKPTAPDKQKSGNSADNCFIHSSTRECKRSLDFYSRSRSRSKKPDCCCEDGFPTPDPCSQIARTPCPTPCVAKKNIYQSGSISRYCDALMAGVEGNPEMIGDIIRDLQCVIEKTCGNSKNSEAKYQSLLGQLAKLKEELCQALHCRAELEKEICRLQGELQAAQFAFEDEARRRMCLERVVSELRGKLSRIEILFEAKSKENAQLAGCLLEMEVKIQKMTDIIAALECERDELLQNCRSFEEWKKKQNDNSNMSQGRLAQLEEALAKCCKANEDLQNEIRFLNEQVNCLKAKVEQLEHEMKRLTEQFAADRDSWARSRCELEHVIAEMKKAIDCLTKSNEDTCLQMRKVVSAHHVEMDCLKKKAEKFQMLYESERDQREKAERALKDCEERKKGMIQEIEQLKSQTMVQQQQQQQRSTPCSPSHLFPCSDILQRLNNPDSDRGEYMNDMKFRLASANEKMAALEMDLQNTKHRDHEKDAALERSTRELEQYKSVKQSLEVQLEKTREEVVQTKSMCEALRATNTQLQIQLQSERAMIERVKPEDAEKMYMLQDENRNLLKTIEEERAAKELFRRELKDSQRLWETEVKAKGILADRITRHERMKTQNEANNNEDSSGITIVKLRESLRLVKTELKLERDQVGKLKAKIEEQRELLRSTRDTLKEASNDSKSRRLTIELDQLKHEHHNFVASVNRDREASRAEICKLEQEKINLEKELKLIQHEFRENELNKEAVREVLRRKDQLDAEVEQLRRALNERYVERSRVDEWKANYETRIDSLRTQYEAAVQAQVKAKLLEMQLALDRQSRDRALIDKMRDSNEDVIRHEQSQITATLQTDVAKLKQAVRAREEEIASLKSSITHLKKKYASESNMKDELLKKLQIMSAASRTSLPSIANNNIM